MKEIIIELTNNYHQEPYFEMYSIYHILYLVIGFAGILLTFLILRKCSKKVQSVYISIMALLIFLFYELDVFIQPLYINLARLDRFPFHLCTFMFFFIPLTRFVKQFNFLKNQAVTLSFVASFAYVFVPGTAVGTYVFSYFSMQTVIYHFFMLTFSFLSLSLKDVELNIKDIWKDALMIVFIYLWASVGNYFYPGYDWLFLEGTMLTDIFPFLTKTMIQIGVPIVLFIGVLLIYLVDIVIKKINKKIKKV